MGKCGVSATAANEGYYQDSAYSHSPTGDDGEAWPYRSFCYSEGVGDCRGIIKDPNDRAGLTGRIYQYGFGSWHPGVCNFLLADGAVVSINSATPVGNYGNYSILLRLMDCMDGMAVMIE